MKKHNYLIAISIIATSLFSCSSTNGKADAYGNFEATEVIVSTENSGKIIQFDINEGDLLLRNQLIGFLDTIPLSLKKEQLQVNKTLIHSKSQSVLSQIAVLKAKLKTANTNKKRIENLLKEGAGTQKDLDDLQGEINVTQQQIRSVEMQNSAVISELKSIDVQLKQVADQLKKSKIINPIKGTVLTKYVEPNEITSFGRPLYKIANLNYMELRVYISETQLTNITIGQEVTVKIDAGDAMKSYKGNITWIASEAEFTPKIIQTKEERVALVYAVKVTVANDGGLKIGMPAEMWIQE